MEFEQLRFVKVQVTLNDISLGKFIKSTLTFAITLVKESNPA
jgi:hypothetical protein